MTADSITPLQIIGLGLIALVTFILLLIGVDCLIRFFRTRERKYLITGLLLTLIIPGCLFCAWVVYSLPGIWIMYGPPPSNHTP